MVATSMLLPNGWTLKACLYVTSPCARSSRTPPAFMMPKSMSSPRNFSRATSADSAIMLFAVDSVPRLVPGAAPGLEPRLKSAPTVATTCSPSLSDSFLASATMEATSSSGVMFSAARSAYSYCFTSSSTIFFVALSKVKSRSVTTLPYSYDCAYFTSAPSPRSLMWESPPKTKSTYCGSSFSEASFAGS